MGEPGPIVVLCGGVGAARFLRGLVRCVPPDEVVALINTGDDCTFYGVHVAPDLDIVSYTLAGRVDDARGFGLAGDSFHLIDALAAFGHPAWFRLGDRDYATCLHRTLRLRAGAGLAAVTDEIRTHLGVASRLLPMSEDPCPTRIERTDGTWTHFEEYLVRDGAPSHVRDVDLSAAGRARPAPGVLEVLRAARAILLAPSNPVVSIGPILAVPGVRDALASRRAPAVAVSPIVGGAPVKGPADHLLRARGVEVSARGVAGLYRGLVDGFVIDRVDADQAADVEAAGLRAHPVDTLMRNPDAAARLADQVLDLAQQLG